MPSTLLTEDLQQSIQDQLQQHAQQAIQSVQQAVQPVQQAVAPPQLSVPTPDLSSVQDQLSQYAQQVAAPVQQAAGQPVNLANPTPQPGIVPLDQSQKSVQQQLSDYAQEKASGVIHLGAPETPPQLGPVPNQNQDTTVTTLGGTAPNQQGTAAPVSSPTAAQTGGVDPAIIHAIQSTETGAEGRARGELTLGIGTAAKSGQGSSGMSWGTDTAGAVEAGQPGRFWAYKSVPEAADAFKNYIHNNMADLEPYLGDAQSFFQHMIDTQSNYYVPMAGGQSKTAYYTNWKNTAADYAQTNPNAAPISGGGDTSSSTVAAPSIDQKLLDPSKYGYGDATPRNGEPIKFIVNHVAEGNGSLADVYKNQDENTHYWVGKDGTIEQYVPDDQASYGAGKIGSSSNLPPDFPGNGQDYNRQSINIEREGMSNEAPTQAQWQSLVKLNQYLASKYNVPWDADHIVGHYRTDGDTRAADPYVDPQFYMQSLLNGQWGDTSPGAAAAPPKTGALPATTPANNLAVTPSSRAVSGDSTAMNQSQFGDSQLTTAEAYAACGPAAAVRFAEKMRRNPTLREATDMASQVGWTSGGGMAGIQSEQKLMTNLGVPTHIVAGPQWDAFAKEAQSGNPVTISTSAHYFYADGYDPTSGAFHVGRSGLDLVGGSEWMTPQQMTAQAQRLGGGEVQGALFADNPTVPGQSQAQTASNSSTQTFMGANEPADIGTTTPQRGRPPIVSQGPSTAPPPPNLGAAAQQVGGAVGGALGAIEPNAQAAVQQTSQNAISALQAQADAAQRAADDARARAQQVVTPVLGAVSQAPQAVQNVTQQVLGTAQQGLGAAAQAVQAAPAQVQAAAAPVLGAVQQTTQQGLGAVQSTVKDLQQAGAPVVSAAQQVAQSPIGQQAQSLAARAPLPGTGSTLGDLAGAPAAVGRVATGVQAAAATTEQERQDYLNQPSVVDDFQKNQAALERGDYAGFVRGSFTLASRVAGASPLGQQGAGLAAIPGSVIPGLLGKPGLPFYQGGPMETGDVSSVVSSGLTAAGVDPDQARLYGQVANLLGPMALEKLLASAPLTVARAAEDVSAAARAAPTAEEAAATAAGRGGVNPDIVPNAQPAAVAVGDRVAVGRTQGTVTAASDTHLTVQPSDGGTPISTPRQNAVIVEPSAAAVGQTARTPITGGGLGTPPYQYPTGSIGETIASNLRQSAQSDPSGVAHLDNAAMQGQPGLPRLATADTTVPKWQTGAGSTLDDLRYAQDVGMPLSQWYSKFAQAVAGVVGDKNINEFRTLFGITSQQTPPTENLQYTLGLMRMAREFMANGTDFNVQNIKNWVVGNPRVTSLGTQGAKWKMNAGQFQKVADLYNNGAVKVATNAKTSSYASNILSALLNRFDPNSTMDTWMAQIFNYRFPNRTASSDQAFQAMRTVVDHLAGETGQVPHQAQAAMWFAIKGAKDFAASKVASPILKAIVKDFGAGRATLRQVIDRAAEEGAYNTLTGTWDEVSKDKGVADELGKLQPLLEQDAPRPAVADSSYLYYPGKGTKLAGVPKIGSSVLRQSAVAPVTTAARQAFAEQTAPTVTGAISDAARAALGHNADSGQFESLNTVPHTVQGDQVLAPGGNMDTLRYIASRIGQADPEGATSALLHVFHPDAPDLAGWQIHDIPQGAREGLQRDLNAADIPNTVLSDGTIRVGALPQANAAYEQALGEAVQGAGAQIRRINGVVRQLDPAEHQSTLSQLGERFGAGEQRGVPGPISGGVVRSELGAGAVGPVEPGAATSFRAPNGEPAAAVGGAEPAAGFTAPGRAAGAAEQANNASGAAQSTLDRVRDLLSSTQSGGGGGEGFLGRQEGSANPRFALNLGSAVGGGLLGAATTPTSPGEDDQTIWRDRALRALAFGGTALGASSLATGYHGSINQQTLENLRAQGVVGGGQQSFVPLAGAARGPIARGVDVTKQSMLSNPATHTAYVIGNLLQLLRQPATLAMGGRGADALSGLVSVGRGVPAATDAARAAFSGQSLPTLAHGASLTGGPVYRVLGAVHAFTRTLGEYQGMAQEANRLLGEAGMSANDPSAAQYLASHAAEIWNEGRRVGAGAVFTRPNTAAEGNGALDAMFRTYSNAKEGLLASPRLRDQALGALMDFAVPFSGIPAQMLSIATNRLPGLTQLSGGARVARALVAHDMPGAQRALGETALESSIQLMIAKQIADGNITGSDDPSHPDSVNLPGAGWVDMKDMGAWSLPMRIMANFAEGYEKGGQNVPASAPGANQLEKYAGYYGPRFSAALTASMKPFAQAVPGENMMKFIADVGTGGGIGQGFLGQGQNIVNRVASPGALRFIEQLTDPVARDIDRKGIDSLWKGPMSNIPGLSNYVPPKIDPTTGEPQPKASAGPGILIGARQDQSSPITDEVTRLKQAGYTKLSLPSPSGTVSIGGSTIHLSPDEQRQVTEITGKKLGNFADKVASPSYQNRTNDQKALLMHSYLTAAQQSDANATLRVLGRPELVRRIAAGRNVEGQLNTQAEAPGIVPEDFSFDPTSGLSAIEQRRQQLTGAAA